MLCFLALAWELSQSFLISIARSAIFFDSLVPSIDIKNENTQLFSMDSVDETIQEGYDAIMAHKDEILKVFGEQNSAE